MEISSTIFICDLDVRIQDKIKETIKRYLKKEECYSTENLEDAMANRLCNLNVDGFTRQYNNIVKFMQKNFNITIR